MLSVFYPQKDLFGLIIIIIRYDAVTFFFSLGKAIQVDIFVVEHSNVRLSIGKTNIIYTS